MFDQAKYRTFLFDCDGVILDSNNIKTQAFYELTFSYGADAADKLVAYHKENGGISRFRKLEYFFREILRQQNCDNDISDLAVRYGEVVYKKLMVCPLTNGCEDFLRGLLSRTFKFVISGGLESEIQDIFRRRGLIKYFDAVFGSPRSKEEILRKLLEEKKLVQPAIFFGDSYYDYRVAKDFGLDFIFLSSYSELKNIDEFLGPNDIIVRDFSHLVKTKL